VTENELKKQETAFMQEHRQTIVMGFGSKPLVDMFRTLTRLVSGFNKPAVEAALPISKTAAVVRLPPLRFLEKFNL